MENQYGEIVLQKGREQSLHRKHPWIFSGAIHSASNGLTDGDLVKVYDKQRNCLGTGMYAPGSIMVRMLSFDDVAIDNTFWQSKIKGAYEYRQQILQFPAADTNAFRLIHGEGDGVPGLIIDIYNKVAVVQCHTPGIFRCLPDIVNALINVLGDQLTTVYNKSKESLGGKNDITDGVLWGNEVESDTIAENGHLFNVNWAEGQKTGFFLDQRDNRRLVGEYSKDKSVLNCFSYTGGFSVYAAKNGATSVVSVDISSKAVALADHNAQLNQCQNHQGITANVLEYLSQNQDVYDIVIVDPPAFAKSMSKRHNAIQAYKRLNTLAIKAVKPGGLLFTFSCSQVVTTQLFYDTIVAAGIEAGRNVRVMFHLSQGADHPVNLFHPEGHYLKGLMLFVE